MCWGKAEERREPASLWQGLLEALPVGPCQVPVLLAMNDLMGIYFFLLGVKFPTLTFL